ncbi:winged helix-turn-helix domain-containing protein [Amycolatopsis sp. NPDC059657]|uniref:winged helix-turn-helix domain-containing protein n=1 Tax=Amycolatopsis sp. NPDC059657 TaxID=3346899 RepID=UPI00367216B5
MNLRTRQVRLRDQHLPLSPIEFRMLHVLMVNANRVSSAQLIEQAVYGTERHRTAPVRISRTIGELRRKLGDRNRTLIRNAHGLGYRLVGRTPSAR